MFSRFKIIRPLNLVFMLTAHVLVYKHSFVQEEDDFLLLFAFTMACLLTAAAGYVVNDLFDIKADEVNKPKSAIVNGSLTKGQAWVYYLILLTASVFFANSCSREIILLVLGIHTGLYVYAFWLKRLPLIGSVLISFLTGFLFYATTFVLLEPNPIIMELSVLAAGVTWVRELIKTAEDHKGDKIAGFKTISVLKGKLFTYRLATISAFVFTQAWLIFCIIVSFSSPIWHIGNLILLLSLSAMGVRWYISKEKKTLYSGWIKVLMLISLFLGFYY